MKYPENFEILTPSEAEFNEVWGALIKEGCEASDSRSEQSYKGMRTRIKRSTTLGYMWTSQVGIPGAEKPVYSVAEFKAAFPALFQQQATMDDIIQIVALDQELGCMQAELSNLMEMIANKAQALGDMKRKFNIAP